MRKDLFIAMIKGFQDGLFTDSIRAARQTDKRLRQAKHFRGYFHHHGQISPYDDPSYTFSKLQQDFENSLEYARFYGSPERQKENEEVKKMMSSLT
jgi:hypothetical protein